MRPAPDTTVQAAGDRAWPPVSAVMTVRDEERHLARAVRGVLEQDYLGELELVLAVGPSRDRTAQIAQDLAARDPRVVVISNPSGRTPAGLNRAIARARHEVIMRVDGHGPLTPGYVRTAVRLLQETGADNVGGVMAAEGESPFEQAVARAMTSRFGVGNAAFHVGGKAGPADTVYLGVFRRGTLEALDGYDERFCRAQDWELNHRIRLAGGLVWFSPELQVTYCPRATLTTLARQYFCYGRWRRQIMRRHVGTVSVRYLAAPTAVVGILLGLLVAALVHPVGALLPLAYVALLVAGAVATASRLPATARVALPVVYATMHLSWGVGFLSGARRLSSRPQTRRVRELAGS